MRGRRAALQASIAPAHRPAANAATMAPFDIRGPAMQIAIADDARKRAIQSIERYFSENMEERIGNVAAGSASATSPPARCWVIFSRRSVR